MITALWIYIICYTSVSVIWTNWQSIMFCAIPLVTKEWYIIWTCIMGTYFILACIFVIYIYIFWTALKQRKKISSNVSYNSRMDLFQTIRDTKATKTLLLLVVFYAVCFLPISTIFLIMVYHQPNVELLENRSSIRSLTFAGIFYLVNSAINTIVYSIQMKQFNIAYRKLLGLKVPQTLE